MFEFLSGIIISTALLSNGFSFITQAPVRNIEVQRIPVEDRMTIPVKVNTNSLGIETTATSIAVFDEASGQLLYGKNQYHRQPIASITKLMTAIVVSENVDDWDALVEITAEDYREGNIVYLLQGETATVREIFNLMLIASSNEAAAALARHTLGENFIAVMNQRAAQLGMENAAFVDPTGLSQFNIASATDLKILASVAFANQDIVNAVTRSEYDFATANTQRLVQGKSTNQLLKSFINQSPYTINGAKTGYLNEAGYCLLTQVQRDSGEVLTVVLLGAASQIDRWQEVKGLVDWVFGNYEWR